MDSLTLDAIPLWFDLEQLCKTLRMKEGSEPVGKLKRLLAQAQSAAKPKAFYRPAFIDSRTDDRVIPEAEPEAIEGVYKKLATKDHPDARFFKEFWNLLRHWVLFWDFRRKRSLLGMRQCLYSRIPKKH